MTAKTNSLNSVFRYHCLVDLDTETVTTYDAAYAEKEQRTILCRENSTLLWPMVQIGEEIYHYSAAAAALIADTDYNNDGIPYVSFSNKSLKISGLCLADGTEVILDLEQANLLNSQGIVTAINMNGWKAWGNPPPVILATPILRIVSFLVAGCTTGGLISLSCPTSRRWMIRQTDA